jgi:hypothetical protein
VPAADTLEFHVAPKAKLVKTLESAVEAESTSFVISLGGKKLDGIPEPTIRIAQDETVRVTDEYQTVADGRATKLVRTYDDLAANETQSFQPPEGAPGEPREKKDAKKSALEGQSVVFTWNDADDEYKAAWAEGSKGDDDLLGELIGNYDFTEFLPGKPVASGDTWDLGKAQFERLFSPTGELGLETEGDEDDDDLSKQFLEHLAGKGKATYKGLRDGDEDKLAVISLEAELSTHGAKDGEDDKSELEISLDLEGEILWDVKAGHLRSFEITAKVEVVQTIHGSVDAPDGKQEVEQKIEFGGKQTLKGTVDS